MKRIQVNTVSKTRAIDEIVAGVGIRAYIVAWRRAEVWAQGAGEAVFS